MIYVDILAINDKPIALPIEKQTEMNTKLTFSIMPYVIDEEDIKNLNITLGDDLSLVSLGTFGTVDENLDVTFTPDLDMVGQVNITYSACDNDPFAQKCDNSTITIDLGSGVDLLTIPNGISPNGDGLNDLFVIKNLVEDGANNPKYIDGIYGNYLTIFNRWGNIVYELENYPPDLDVSQYWGGQYIEASIKDKANKTIVPEGTYFYIITFYTDANKQSNRTITGYLILKY